MIPKQLIPPPGRGPFIAGDTLVIEFSVTDDSGAAKDLSGAVIRFVAAEYQGGEPVIEKTVGNGISVTDAAAGEFSATVHPEDTESLAGHLYYETEVTDNAGTVATVASGTWIIDEDTA